MFLCQFKEIAELNDVEIIGVTLSTSANRKRGKSKLSSIEETWEDCCGFVPRGAKLACCQAWKSPTQQRKSTNKGERPRGALTLSSCASAKFTQRN